MLRHALVLGLGVALVGCPKPEEQKKKADPVDYTRVSGEGKALLYNLVGRWFPDSEIKRLDVDSMTPEEWCSREPTHVEVLLDEVRARCEDGELVSAAIARVERNPEGGITIILRAKEDAKMREVIFRKAKGTMAAIAGTPCYKEPVVEHFRFPEIERLKREVMAGQRCAQLKKDELPVDPEDF